LFPYPFFLTISKGSTAFGELDGGVEVQVGVGVGFDEPAPIASLYAARASGLELILQSVSLFS